jgi:hypothetical protein
MEIKPKRIIKKYPFLFQSILIIFNTLMLMRVVFTFTFHRIITHETIWSFILSSFYLIFIFISDANLFLFNSTKLEKFNSFIRNSYSIIAYSYCYSITIEFWLILFCGITFGKNPFAGKKVVTRTIVLESLYLHLGITIVMVIDLIFTERKIENKNWNNKILLVINLIYFCYSIVVLCANYVFFMPAYPFMENAGAGLMILIFGISFILINSCFYLH